MSAVRSPACLGLLLAMIVALPADARMAVAQAEGPVDRGLTTAAPASPAAPESVGDELRNSRVGQLIERFTYAAIILVLLLCGMGLPLPEEVPILTSAILSQGGHLHPWWALGACMFGVMLGDSIMYLLGRRWGTHVLDHRLSRKLLTPERHQKIVEYFERYGARIIFVARFLPGIRAPLFLTAGTMRVTFWTFFGMDGAAALISVPLSFWFAYIFTDQIGKLLDVQSSVKYWGIALVAVGLIGWLIIHLVWKKRIAAIQQGVLRRTDPKRVPAGSGDEIRHRR